MQSILASAVADSTGKEQRILKRAETWFEQQVDLAPNQQLEAHATKEHSTLSLRQIALVQHFLGKPIRNDARAAKLAAQAGRKSVELLVRRYNEISAPTGISGREGKEIPPMIKDLKVAKQNIDVKYFSSIDAYLKILEAEIS